MSNIINFKDYQKSPTKTGQILPVEDNRDLSNLIQFRPKKKKAQQTLGETDNRIISRFRFKIFNLMTYSKVETVSQKRVYYSCLGFTYKQVSYYYDLTESD